MKANPEIRQCTNIHCRGIPCLGQHGRDIRLADVLLALTLDGGSRFNVITYKRGPMAGKANILRENMDRFVVWNLRHDSLEWHRDNQPETVEWLAELLTNN